LPDVFHRDFSDRIESRHADGEYPAKQIPGQKKRPQRGACRRSPVADRPSPRKFSLPSARRLLPPPGWFPLIGALVGFMLMLLLISSGGNEVDAHASIPHEEWLTPALTGPEKQHVFVQKTTVKEGDNAVSAIARLGFGLTASNHMVAAANSVYDLKNIGVGQIFERFDSMAGSDVYYHIDKQYQLHLHQQSGQTRWQAKKEKRKVNIRRRVASGIIHDSLLGDAAIAGLDRHTTMNMVDIFSWDIDFARDMRDGDTFQILYDERFDNEGHSLGTTILAAAFTNMGKTYRAVRYKQADGRTRYFTPEGKSMQKAYLKAPVKFSRISSRFQRKRKHPVLGYTRAHRGVDYAAARGTPVRAVGDGFVESIGRNGGFGRLLVIRHNNRNHSTAYAHLSRFADGLSKGKHVRQGQTIGYVGMSGLATGPHLHFEFRVRNQAVNPLSIKRTPASPVPRKERTRFRLHTAPLLTKMGDKPSLPDWG